jgi:lipoprotein-anchoring transpeptidase ErfK/SrfK
METTHITHASEPAAPPPQVADMAVSMAAFNPEFDANTLTAAVTGATRVEVSVVPAAGGAPIRTWQPELAGQQLKAVWDGRTDEGKPASPGDYRFQVKAFNGSVDSTTQSDPFSVINKRIIVSLDRQELLAYEGNKLIVDSLVTTGGPELPTPSGTFHVMYKTSPMIAYSPWPKGSPYWFEPVTYTYAMEFFENAQYGLYIHDASWRDQYGPGSNTVDGIPGQDTTGTHGCINVPLAEQSELYPWAPVGTPVIVQH